MKYYIIREEKFYVKPNFTEVDIKNLTTKHDIYFCSHNKEGTEFNEYSEAKKYLSFIISMNYLNEKLLKIFSEDDLIMIDIIK